MCAWGQARGANSGFWEDLCILIPLKCTVVFRSVTVNVSQFFEGTMKAGKSHKYMVSTTNV